MIYKAFQGQSLSMLGFGTMRLPQTENGDIDERQLDAMVDYAISHGVNYFDTAYPYHGGMSEVLVGRSLSRYPRESYCLATKYPGHQISSSYHPEEIFEEQLKKCGVDYFDFYLLHNVYEKSMDVYLDPLWGIIDYFKEQRRLGRIRHLGFSTHAKPETLRAFLDRVGEDMEFCQIQLNWLDRTLQNAEEKVAILNERRIPIWVMEPVRGGKLCHLSEKEEAALRALRPQESIPAWGFRYLQSVEGVTVILSGMSNMEQMKENIATFETPAPLTESEKSVLFAIAEGMRSSVPCTACRYCTDGCPMGLDIPALIATYNDLSVEAKVNPAMWIQALPPEKQPSACIGCGACAAVCPQNIDIPGVMKSLSDLLLRVPNWADICRTREEEAARLKKKT